MKSFELILNFPTGSVMVGGHTKVPEGLHAAHARDKNDCPIIPATSIRGALRESLEAVLRGAELPACAAGTGLSPEKLREGAVRPVLCVLDNGRRCVTCRLFGTQRAAIGQGERRFSDLILSAARIVTRHASWSIRPGVSIARRTRSAEDNRFFLASAPAPSRTLRFIAEGHLLDPDLERYFEAAVRSTTHLGSGRSRGMARVDMALQWEAASPSPAPRALPGDGDIRLRVKLLSPASIGVPIANDTLRDTRLEIPGAALRGAVGFALAGVLEDPADPAFQALVAENGAHFGFLYPTDDDPGETAAPLPITAVACKYERRSHGIVDTLLDRLAAEHIESAVQIAAVERTSLSRCGATGCRGPFRSIEGARRMRELVPTRAVTRLSMDRTSSSAQDKHLFMQVLLEEGTSFEGTIRNIPSGSRERLSLVLARSLSLGRGRSSGWGKVRVEVSSAPAQAPLTERGKTFDEALRRRLAEAALPAHRVGRLVPVTLLSPLIPSPGDEDGSGEMARALDAARCFLRVRRFSREGGWDQMKGRMEPALATAAGAIFVFELDEGKAWGQLLPALERLERWGVGQRRHQGYGHVRCFDPFICARTTTR